MFRSLVFVLVLAVGSVVVGCGEREREPIEAPDLPERKEVWPYAFEVGARYTFPQNTPNGMILQEGTYRYPGDDPSKVTLVMFAFGDNCVVNAGAQVEYMGTRSLADEDVEHVFTVRSFQGLRKQGEEGYIPPTRLCPQGALVSFGKMVHAAHFWREHERARMIDQEKQRVLRDIASGRLRMPRPAEQPDK